MPGKKSAKSSKTDHVLNLIAGMSPGQEGQAEKEAPAPKEAREAPPAGQEAPPPYQPAAAPPILEVARTNHEAVAETIHRALEQALEEELAEEAAQKAAPPPPPREEPERLPPVSEPAPPEAPAPEPAPVFPSPAPVPEAPPPAGVQRLPDGSSLVNVMQILVEENLKHYTEMFRVCPCPRCTADVKALALTQLPAKYVVLEEGTFHSMLSFYQYRYASDITVALTKASCAVAGAPRHSSPKAGAQP